MFNSVITISYINGYKIIKADQMASFYLFLSFCKIYFVKADVNSLQGLK